MARKTKAEKAQEAIDSATAAPTDSRKLTDDQKASLTDKSVILDKEFAGDNTYVYTETKTYSPDIGTGNLDLVENFGGSVSGYGSSGDSTSNAALKALDMTNLPLTYKVNVPDFSSVFSITDFGNPESFSAAGLKRVTTAQREKDKVSYQEIDNYLQNVTDGLKVTTTAMGAAIQAAKLGQASIKYAIAREGIETEQVNYQTAQVKTAQAQATYDAERIKLQFAQGQNVVNGAIYSTKLASLRLTLQEERHTLQSKQAEVAALLGGATY